ncbi:hypothetical protein WMF27_42150 [Sorangium sp. So ce281]|uniref:hypothetical protein n=1 Tax=unclassified Sorangium TaxID=2621164 RepID=UPI003F5DE660
MPAFRLSQVPCPLVPARSRPRSPPSSRPATSAPARLNRAPRAALAGAWLDSARAECGAIPAFLALAQDLAAVGALVARALAALGDEVHHTARCSELASALAG